MKRDLNKPLVIKAFADFDPAKFKGNTFGSEEKLKSKKTIDKLFNEGKSVTQNGFTLIYLYGALNTFFPAQAGFTVPKRNFKKAVDRNRVKRLMREAYRLNKTTFYNKLIAGKQQMALMFVFKGKSIPNLDVVVKAVITCLNKVSL